MYFYPRSPCGERHRVGIFGNKPYHISIHALLAESDPGSKIHHPGKILFLSTLSLRRATTRPAPVRYRRENFYPRSPCGERLEGTNCAKTSIAISIHALLAESDVARNIVLTNILLFLSTLSLRRATLKTPPQGNRSRIFLSTLSLRRATQHWCNNQSADDHFYPRSPCGERQEMCIRDRPHLARRIGT